MAGLGTVILVSVGWTKMVVSALLVEIHANIHIDNRNRSYKTPMTIEGDFQGQIWGEKLYFRGLTFGAEIKSVESMLYFFNLKFRNDIQTLTMHNVSLSYSI